jgi:thiamine biosynthesis lipoprotein
MTLRLKNILYASVLVIVLFIVWKVKEAPGQEPMKIEGATMGTTYHITYFDELKRDFKKSVDSILIVVNKSINTYDSSSEISLFNKAKRGVRLQLPYFLPPLKKAIEVNEQSQGAFDPTVMPLVNAWGFGPGKTLKTDSVTIDSILQFVGLEKIKTTEDSILKTDLRVQLDFGGIGQGYGADVITSFLKSKGITHMLVELGGEGMACGRNLKTGRPWEIGILDPNSTYENQFFKAYVSLSDRSFTTSGNYFNYREIDGVKYSHTINPATGFPVKLAILSASVFSKDCTTADAWGTALMVMGHEKAIELLKTHPELDALLMYSNARGEIETYATPGIEKSLKLEN